MSSKHVNWWVAFVYALLVLDLILIGRPAAAADNETSSKSKKGSKKPPANKTLSTPLECARECREGETPKICYYHFTLELYDILGGACDLCTPDNTNALNSTCQCILADGVERGLTTVNRMLPGPSIQVCKGDKIVVDVENKMEGEQVTIHWHGVFQTASPYYDGVPFITQCPILKGNTFRYQYLADNEGTHFWHAHTGVQKMDGIHGSLVIRVPPKQDPNSCLYDYDLPTHVVLIADWMHDQSVERFPGRTHTNTGQLPDSILINGKGRYTDPNTNVSTTTPYEVLTVKPGYRYRIRLINSFCTVCPAEFTIENHNLTLISVDGVPVKPTNITTIISYPGERCDFVITAENPIRSYWIQVRGLGECADAGVQQHAILQYKGEPEQPTSVKPTYTNPLPPVKVLNPQDGLCNETRNNAICISQLRSAVPVDKEVITGKPCVKFYFSVGFSGYRPTDVFKPNTYNNFLVPPGGGQVTAFVNNISFEYPHSPPLSQFNDIPESIWCYQNNTAANCSGICKCAQRIDIPLNCIVEVVLSDGAGIPTLAHPIHMHGYAYNVVGMGRSPIPNATKMTADSARKLDADNKLCRNLDQPPYKDTVAIPPAGYVILRYRANNPGWWLMHCHFLYHILVGMELVLHVGEPKDLSPVPPGFPKCADHLPPIQYDNC